MKYLWALWQVKELLYAAFCFAGATLGFYMLYQWHEHRPVSLIVYGIEILVILVNLIMFVIYLRNRKNTHG